VADNLREAWRAVDMVSEWKAVLEAVAMLVLVNGAPILARDLFGRCCAWPMDFGLYLRDGNPLLGVSKTWRGLLSALLAGGLGGLLLGFGLVSGLLFGAWAMAGDAISSFIKRRLGLMPSARFRGLDQCFESLMPLWMLRAELGLDGPGILVAVVLFTLFEWWISPLLHRLRIRDRPW
jgi:CDP-2,3-bis-(O-geranylgeranyl)-sn-glycerol synthase